MKITVAIWSGFSTSVSKLPKAIQKKAWDAVDKFKNDPYNPGLNFEAIGKLYSIRIDLTYRIILHKDDKEGVFVLLYADHHDEAYQWAEKKQLSFSSITGAVQLITIEEVVPDKIAVHLFDKYTEDQLLALGVPDVQIPLVRSIIDQNHLYTECEKFASDVYERLEMLVEGFDYPDVLETVPKGEKPATLSESLMSEASKQSFYIVEGQDSLKAIMDAPLEKWRVFLHPQQRKVAFRDFNGPAKVSGQAGTGKTVVAMHRTKYLLEQGKKVLFTTFTANLGYDIEKNIKGIVSFRDLKRLEINNVDSLIASVFNSLGTGQKIIYDDSQLRSVWYEAIQKSGCDLLLDEAFFLQEWRKIACVLDRMDVQSYLVVPRIGRGTRLDRPARLKVWQVFEEYMTLIKQKGICDADYAAYLARSSINSTEGQYDSIVVDEAQDIGTNAFKFLRRLAGPEHENDLFIVGDSHQRIYKNKTTLSRCGINVKGRSSVLHLNYRTTEETQRYAFAFLKGIPFDDLDGEILEKDKCLSLTHGDAPEVKNFADFEEQMAYTCDEIRKLLTGGAVLNDICIVARGKKQTDAILEYLEKEGIEHIEVKREEDDSDLVGVRVATMHRIKGLEFRYIFAVCINKDIIPSVTKTADEVENDENLLIERCLLYVALTRAQIKAYVFSYGKESPFLAE